MYFNIIRATYDKPKCLINKKPQVYEKALTITNHKLFFFFLFIYVLFSDMNKLKVFWRDNAYLCVLTKL